MRFIFTCFLLFCAQRCMRHGVFHCFVILFEHCWNIQSFFCASLTTLCHARADNRLDVASVCRLVHSVLHSPQLCKVDFDYLPSDCVSDSVWHQAGLPSLPKGVWPLGSQGWFAVLKQVQEVSSRTFCAKLASIQHCSLVHTVPYMSRKLHFM